MEDKPRRRNIEREFGVPVAGEILPPSQWTRTALKKFPAQGSLDWTGLFGRQAPVVLDIGCGNGRFLIGSAVWRPESDHLGIDVLPLVIRYATRRANQRGLSNIRFGVCDGWRLMQHYVRPGSVKEIHCYHPQPYQHPSQFHRRLITPGFLALVHRALEPGGQFFIQSDNPGYWSYIRARASLFFAFQERDRPWPDAPRGRTRREIIALRRGLPIFRGTGSPKPDLILDEILLRAEALPVPAEGRDEEE